MLRWAFYIAGALALIVLVVVVIGYLLPVAHVVSRHATFAAPPERVFAVLTEVNEFPAWRPGVQNVEVLSAEPLRWRERGGNGDITFEVQERIVPARLVTRIADPTLPFGGTWTFELVPEGSGTRLTITERGEVYNPVFRFVSRFIIGHEGSIEQYLAALEGRISR